MDSQATITSIKVTVVVRCIRYMSFNPSADTLTQLKFILDIKLTICYD